MLKEPPKINRIYCGDCRELLKGYPDNFFDCCVSDVPYKIVTGGLRISEESIAKFGKTDPAGILSKRVCTNKLKSKWLKQNDIDSAILVSKGQLFEHCDIKFKEWLPAVYRVMKDGSHAYFMINSRNLVELVTEAEKVGFKFLNLLVWVKNNATPNKFYMQKCEFVVLMRKGFARTINDKGTTNVFAIPNIIGNKFHPTEKPVELMKIFIEQSTKEGDIVLEPFAGAGATCIAAKELGRSYVASEIDERFYKITKERLEGVKKRNGKIDEKGQQSLF